MKKSYANLKRQEILHCYKGVIFPLGKTCLLYNCRREKKNFTLPIPISSKAVRSYKQSKKSEPTNQFSNQNLL